MINGYSTLPGYLPPEEISALIKQVLETKQHKVALNDRDVLKALFELAHRQWLTYTLLEERTKSRVESFINNILRQGEWVDMPVLTIRYLLSIIGNPGLARSYDLLLALDRLDASQESRRAIQDFIRSIQKHRGGQVEDPYYSLKNP